MTNQSQGAVLFEVEGGQLKSPVVLQTGGEGSLSGALSDRGAYVLTGRRLLFFPKGEMTATSSQSLLMADGSAAQVTFLIPMGEFPLGMSTATGAMLLPAIQ